MKTNFNGITADAVCFKVRREIVMTTVTSIASRVDSARRQMSLQKNKP